jgi:DNA replication protein DnaC
MKAELLELAKRFHLKAFATEKPKIKDGLPNEEYLLEILRNEARYRDERAINERIKKACLPTIKSFEEFDYDWQKCITKEQLDTLARLEWIDEAFNLILIGPSGTGKTHLALAASNKAVREGYNVFFATMDNLVHILKTAEISTKSTNKLRFIKKCDLLVIDELGYLPVSRTEANFFFALISELYEHTSIVITSNKGFDGWAEVLGDSVLATALLDRLTHKCQVLSFVDNGENSSWRFAHRRQIFN